MISKTDYTSNLTETLYNKILSIVGATYTCSQGVKNIKIVGAYPLDIETYANELPLIILDKGNKGRTEQLELGGKRKYSDSFYIYIIAGGFKDELVNEFMKNSLVDKLLFGFDNKVFDFINYNTNVIEGIYHTDIEELYRVNPTQYSVFEAHKSVLQLRVWSAIRND